MAGTAAHLLADHDEGGCVLGRHQALSATECHVHRIQLAQGRAAGRHTQSAWLRLGQYVISSQELLRHIPLMHVSRFGSKAVRESKHMLLTGHGMQGGYWPYPGCGAGAGATAGTGACAGAGAGTGGATGAGAGAGRMSGGGGGESTFVRKTSFTAVGADVAFGGGGLRAGGGGLGGGGGLQACAAALRIVTAGLKKINRVRCCFISNIAFHAVEVGIRDSWSLLEAGFSAVMCCIPAAAPA